MYGDHILVANLHAHTHTHTQHKNIPYISTNRIKRRNTGWCQVVMKVCIARRWRWSVKACSSHNILDEMWAQVDRIDMCLHQGMTRIFCVFSFSSLVLTQADRQTDTHCWRLHLRSVDNLKHLCLIVVPHCFVTEQQVHPHNFMLNGSSNDKNILWN